MESESAIGGRKYKGTILNASPLVGGLWHLVTDVIDPAAAIEYQYGYTGTVHAYEDCNSIGRYRENTTMRLVRHDEPIERRCDTCRDRLLKELR